MKTKKEIGYSPEQMKFMNLWYEYLDKFNRLLWQCNTKEEFNSFKEELEQAKAQMENVIEKATKMRCEE